MQNARTGKRYGLIEHAFVEAEPGDHILLEPGTYAETIEFDDKPLTLNSVDPSDPVIVAGVVVRGQSGTPAVTYAGRESADCVLDGLTIRSETVGISCRDAAPTIRNCVVDCPQGIALEYWAARAPTLIDCTLAGQVKEGGDPGLIAYWMLDETEGSTAPDIVGTNHGTVAGDAAWRPEGGLIAGTLELDGIDDFVTADRIPNLQQRPFSVFAGVKGGAPGQVILSQDEGADWLLAVISVHTMPGFRPRGTRRRDASVSTRSCPPYPPWTRSIPTTAGRTCPLAFRGAVPVRKSGTTIAWANFPMI